MAIEGESMDEKLIRLFVAEEFSKRVKQWAAGGLALLGLCGIGLYYALLHNIVPDNEAIAKVVTSDDKFQADVAERLAKMPIGSIVAYGGPLARDADMNAMAEKGWLPCDGRQLKRGDYKLLHEAIEDVWHQADKRHGDDVFCLPDLQSRYLRGSTEAAGTASQVGKRNDFTSLEHSHSIPHHRHEAGALYAAIQHRDKIWRLKEVASSSWDANGRVVNDGGSGDAFPNQREAVQVLGSTEWVGETASNNWTAKEVHPRHAIVNWIIRCN